MDTHIIIAAIGGYLLGAIPFGLVLAALAGKGDIRKIGSGNIGATNVLRTGSKGLAIATLLLDAGKAGIAALIAEEFLGYIPSLVAGGAALIGHCYPVWLRFKGGKGVATYFGVLVALSWPVALVTAGTWLLSAFITRISSLSALIAVLVAPVFAYFFGNHGLAILALVLSAVIYIRHGENISRILKGEESKIGQKAK